MITEQEKIIFLKRTGLFEQDEHNFNIYKIKPKEWYAQQYEIKNKKIDQIIIECIKFIIDKAIKNKILNNEVNVDSKKLKDDLVNYVIRDEGLTISDNNNHFCSLSYAYSNPDVIENEISPFIHYILTKNIEIRKINELDLGFKKNIIKNIINNNKKTNGYDVLKYIAFDFKKLQFPNDSFDPLYYLNFYKDIKTAKINPIYHYFTQGINEGRIAKDPWEKTKKLYVKENDRKKILTIKLNQNNFLNNSANYVKEILKVIDGNKFWTSISHDDYKKNSGGVQSLIIEEENYCLKNGLVYLHVSPVYPYTNNLTTRNKSGFNVRVGSKYWENCDLNNLRKIIIKTQGLTFHHLMGYSSSDIRNIINCVNTKANLYLHDFYGICDSIYLQRNGVEFCNAPNVKSNSCELCMWGNDRTKHLQEFLDIASRMNVIANSNFTKNYYHQKINLSIDSISRPFEYQKINNKLKTSNKFKNKKNNSIVYVGAQSDHKGWNEFVSYIKRSDVFAEQFILLCSKDMLTVDENYLNSNGIELIVYDKSKESLIEALRKISPKYIWMVRNCAETLSLILHDAIELDIIPITNINSGNIYNLCENLKLKFILYPEFKLINNNANKYKIILRSAAEMYIKK